MKDFTKDDLKTGMLVESRNGTVWLFINDNFICKNNSRDLLVYNNDLTYIDSDYDIMKVSNIKHGYKLIPQNWTKENIDNDLLWKRIEQKEEPEDVNYIVMHGKKYKLSEME